MTHPHALGMGHFTSHGMNRGEKEKYGYGWKGDHPPEMQDRLREERSERHDVFPSPGTYEYATDRINSFIRRAVVAGGGVRESGEYDPRLHGSKWSDDFKRRAREWQNKRGRL